MKQKTLQLNIANSPEPGRSKRTALRIALMMVIALATGKFAFAQTYQTVAISSGFNYDVVANGTTTNPSATVTTSPFNGLDGVGYVFTSQDFNYYGSTPSYYLPTSRVLTSATTSGLTYQLASYSGNNALELHNTSGTLAFATPVAASQIFVLGTTGSGTSSASFTVNFSDGSTQTGATASYPDWFTGPFEVTVGQRFYLNSNSFDNSYPDPGFYRGTITVSGANCGKLISSITVSQTGSGDLAIMAVSIQTAVIPNITATTPGSVCGSGTVALGATASAGTVNWYTASTGGSAISTGTSYTTSSISSTTNYYVDATSGGCTTGSRTAVAATVKAIPTITGTTPGSTCGTGTVSLGATASAGTINWYNTATSGASLGTGTSWTSPSISSTKSYYADATNSGCTSTSRTLINATVNSIPTISGSGGATICSGSSTGLSASGGSTYSWSPATGLSVTTGASITANPSSTTIYSVTGISAAGCSNSATVTVSVNALPAMGAGAGVAICSGFSTSLTATGGTSYSWSPATGLSATTGASVTANPASTTIYTVTGTNGSGCSKLVTTTVTVNALPTINSGTGAAICNGSSTTLAATGGITYSWSPSTGLSATTGASVTATPAITKTYTITGINAAGCSNTTSTTVTVNTLPTIGAGSGVAICNGASATLTAAGGVTYSWSPSTGLSATSGASVTAAPPATIIYSVTGTNAAGCSNTASVTVTVKALPAVNAGLAAAICSSFSTTLTATGGVTYSWSPSTGLSATSGASITAAPLATTIYSVTGTNSDGCSNTASVAVTVNGLPSVNAGSGVAICNGSSTMLAATGGVTYSWSPSTGLSATTGASVTAAPSTTTIYSVTGTNATGCSNTASVTVTVNALPAVNAGSGVAICNGSSTMLAATGGVTYSWSPSTGLSATTGAGVAATPSITTIYSVTGTDVFGCSNTATAAVTINAIPTIGAGSSVTICNGISTTLVATGGVTYSWMPSTGLPATTGASVTAAPSSTTLYTVTGTSGSGCSNTATVNVTVNSSPVITSIGNGGAICAGSTLTLNSSATGGTGALSYSWAGPNSFSATIANPSVAVATTSATGAYTLTVTDAAGCNATGAAATTGTVNPTPSAGTITGATSVCIGGTITLSNSTVGGIWSSANSMASVGSATGIVTGVAIGRANITYTVTNVYSCSSYVYIPLSIAGLPQYLYTFCGTGANTTTGDGGPAYLATMQAPRALATDTAGNLYFCDAVANKVRMIGTNGYISTIAGNGIAGNTGDGGPATAAELNIPGAGGLYIDNAGNIFISSTNSNVIRKINGTTHVITTIAGTGVAGYSGDGGPATAAKLNLPLGLTEDTSGNLYITDQGNNRIRKIDAVTGIISLIAGQGANAFAGDGIPATNASLSQPRDVVADKSGNLYIVDAGNSVIRKYVIATGIITTIAGIGRVTGSTGDGGPATAAKLNTPARAAFDGSNKLYIADQANFKIRQLDLNTGIISTVVATGTSGYAGDGGPSLSGQIGAPYGVAVNKNGHIFIADASNHRIRLSPYNESVTITLAGSSTVPAGTPVTFTAHASGSGLTSSFQWVKNGANVGAGANTYTDMSPANGDVYSCVLILSPDCGSMIYDSSNTITVSLAGYRMADTAATVVKEVTATGTLRIFPNPVHNQLNIEASGVENGNMQIAVYDQMGRVVINKTVDVNNNEIIEQLDMQSLPVGMYIVSLTDNAGKTRIVKCVKN